MQCLLSFAQKDSIQIQWSGKIFQDIVIVNSLQHSDTLWQCRSGSTLAQVTSHYLSHCLLTINVALWDATSSNFTGSELLAHLPGANKLTKLTHWDLMPHIYVDNLTISDPDNGLSPGRRQAIIWTNAGILLIGPLATNFSEILIEIHTFSFNKIHLKKSSGKCRPFCLGLKCVKPWSHCYRYDLWMWFYFQWSAG